MVLIPFVEMAQLPYWYVARISVPLAIGAGKFSLGEKLKVPWLK